jgi:hypothetical protein
LLKANPAGGPSPLAVRATELANSASDFAGKVAEEAPQRSTQALRSANDMLEQLTDSGREMGWEALTKTAGVANGM